MSTVTLSLLSSEGDVHDSGGLNWGFGAGHTRLNDAYIPIRMRHLSSGAIPTKDGNQHRTVHVKWDDGTEMKMTFEGNLERDGVLYPKQISSADSKDILGKYLRDRLGVPHDQKVTMDDLEDYGRTDVVLTRDGGEYYIDFSS